MTLDEVRTANPGIGLAVYMLEPFGPVTVEAHLPDGRVVSWQGWTVEQALRTAFGAPADDVFA